MAGKKNVGAAEGKTVVLGITGCIAAYKACEIVRGLQKAGVRVKVIMTEHATSFVGPTTFRALTHEKVSVGLFDDPADPIHHISLAQAADAFVIAPATANIIAKLAYGIADDLLSTAALACVRPLMVAPAMNVHMYDNSVTQQNIALLRARGVRFVKADEGYLACGDEGYGRLAQPEVIVSEVLEVLGVSHDLKGRRILITAGPTVEALDPVRYLTNRSSGKTGYALAQAAIRRGAEVVLVSGPCDQQIAPGVRLLSVESARDMLRAAKGEFAQADIAIFAAAVADMRPEHTADHKLKKGKDDQSLSCIPLVKNPDILASLARTKRSDQVVVGFAAETENVIANAQHKLSAKKADMIVGNSVAEGKAFGTEENEVVLVSERGIEELPLQKKHDLADTILTEARNLLEEKVS